MTVYFNKRSAVPQAAGLKAISAPDVCKVPVPGGPPVPTAFVNVASSTDLAGATRRVLIDGKPIAVKDAYISTSKGDQPGSLGGILSNVTAGKTKWVAWSSDVVLEGRGAARFLDPVLMNGNCNNTTGAVDGDLFFDFRYKSVAALPCAACDLPLSQHQAGDFPDITLIDPRRMSRSCDGKDHTPFVKDGNQGSCNSNLIVNDRSFTGRSGGMSNDFKMYNAFSGTDLHDKLEKQINSHNAEHKGGTNSLGKCAEPHSLQNFLGAGGGKRSLDVNDPPKMSLACWFAKDGVMMSPSNPLFVLSKNNYEKKPSTEGLRDNYGGPCAACQLTMAAVFCMRETRRCATYCDRIRTLRAEHRAATDRLWQSYVAIDGREAMHPTHSLPLAKKSGALARIQKLASQRWERLARIDAELDEAKRDAATAGCSCGGAR